VKNGIGLILSLDTLWSSRAEGNFCVFYQMPFALYRKEKSKNRMIYRVPILDEPTKKFSEIPPIINGVITVFVFRLLAPWWQSEESNRADSFTRHTFVT
jgi:hypothetical protein